MFSRQLFYRFSVYIICFVALNALLFVLDFVCKRLYNLKLILSNECPQIAATLKSDGDTASCCYWSRRKLIVISCLRQIALTIFRLSTSCWETLCLQWYNGSITRRVQSCVTNRTERQCIAARPTVDERGISVLNYSLDSGAYKFI